MKASSPRWVVRDKSKLLAAVMDELAGNAHISFEGNLRNLKLFDLPETSQDETSILKRNTTWPKQDFVIVALEPSSSYSILSAIGGTVPRSILHIQVEKAGVLEFGAYDRFDPECMFFGKGLNGEFLKHLVSEALIESAT